jgi:peroxiredoxin
LDFPLLSDPDRTVCRLYGVDSFLGPRRAYFIVDREGILRYQHSELIPVFRREDAELLAILRTL